MCGIQMNAKTVTVVLTVLLLMATSQISRNLGTRPSWETSTMEKIASLGATPLLTWGEMKRTMKLPCNYIHDGFFVPHSNEITNQVYQTLMELQDDDIVPVVIEVGGHDGITKSMSLKSSMCLQANVLLIEASPTNYRVLEKSRRYDTTVHAALCEGGYAEMEESEENSGQSYLLHEGNKPKTKTVKVPCTTLDAELDKLKAKLPPRLRSKLQLVFLVLDVEGFEPIAVKGLDRYSPKKAYIEWTRVGSKEEADMLRWAARHKLEGDFCGPLERDMCFNFQKMLFFDDDHDRTGPRPWMRDVFYGARMEVPVHSATTSKVSGSYMFYGE